MHSASGHRTEPGGGQTGVCLLAVSVGAVGPLKPDPTTPCFTPDHAYGSSMQSVICKHLFHRCVPVSWGSTALCSKVCFSPHCRGQSKVKPSAQEAGLHNSVSRTFRGDSLSCSGISGIRPHSQLWLFVFVWFSALLTDLNFKELGETHGGT